MRHLLRTAALLAGTLLGSPLLRAQDLLERAQSLTVPEPSAEVRTRYSGYDRLDLDIGAGLSPDALGRTRGRGRIGLEAGADLDFACGQFDFKATLRSLFGKEAREEFLDDLLQYGLSQLAGSGLTLLCETSPTACQVFQHYRVNANALLEQNFDWCRAIEEGIDGGLQSAQASAIKACLEEKKNQGLSLDQAKAACRDAGSHIRGLGGTRVAEVDVVKELTRALGLSSEEQASAETLLSDFRYTAKGATGEIQSDTVRRLYAKKYDEYLLLYEELARKARSGGGVTDEDLWEVAPPGTFALSGEDFAALARHEDRFQIHAARMASTSALVSVTDETHKLERWLATARKDPQANSTLIRWLENELADVRMGKRQLEERLAVQTQDREAKKQATAEARTLIYERGARRVAGITRNEAGRKVLRSLPEYGMWGGVDAHGKKVDVHRKTGRGCPPDCPTQKNYFAEE